jgi:hypothetical protein
MNNISLPLSALALAWSFSRPFITSTLVGVSSSAQLRDNILALNIPVSSSGQLAAELQRVFRAHREPTKGVFEVVDPSLDRVDPATLPWGAKDEDVDPELDVLINQRMSRF